MVPLVNWNSYSHYTKLVVGIDVKELLAYDDFYWTIMIEIAQMREEQLGGQGFNYAHDRDLKHHYFDFPCCILEGKEPACNVGEHLQHPL